MEPCKRSRVDKTAGQEPANKRERGFFERTLATIEQAEGHRPTQEQNAIHRFMMEGDGNAIIDAVAGSGKTTTILHCLCFVPPEAQVLVVSFNKSVQTTFQNRLLAVRNWVGAENVPICEVRTCHSFGWKLLQDRFQVAFKDDKRKKIDLIQVLIDEGSDTVVKKTLKVRRGAVPSPC